MTSSRILDRPGRDRRRGMLLAGLMLAAATVAGTAAPTAGGSTDPTDRGRGTIGPVLGPPTTTPDPTATTIADQVVPAPGPGPADQLDSGDGSSGWSRPVAAIVTVVAAGVAAATVIRFRRVRRRPTERDPAHPSAPREESR